MSADVSIANNMLLFEKHFSKDVADLVALNLFDGSKDEISRAFQQTCFSLVSIVHDSANQEVHFDTFNFSKQKKVVYSSFILDDNHSTPWITSLESSDKLTVKQHELPAFLSIPNHEKTGIIQPILFNQQQVGFALFNSTYTQDNRNIYTEHTLTRLAQIFDRRQTHLTLNSQIQTYQAVIDLLPQRVFWKNKDSAYLGANKAFAADAGINNTQDIIHKSDFDVFPNEAEMFRSDDRITMEERKHLLNFEEPLTKESGEKLWLRTSKRPMIDHNDKVIGVAATYDDITQLKEIQEQLENAKQELEIRVEERTKDLQNSNEKLSSTLDELHKAQDHLVETEKLAALGGMVAGVAHEVNTPLGVAVTASSHLKNMLAELNVAKSNGKLSASKFDSFCDKATDAVGLLISNISRASEQIQNFKLVAVDQTNDRERMLNIPDYIEHTIDSLSPVYAGSNIKVSVEATEIITSYTFPGALAQLTTNLLENAIKHAFDVSCSGHFSVSIHKKDAHIEIIFADNGKGISQNSKKKIFEPFYTTKRGEGGSGLGLNIVYNLVTQRLKGKIHCESKLGEGSRFIVNIPIQSKPTDDKVVIN